MNQNGIYFTAGLLLLVLGAISLTQSAFTQSDRAEKNQSTAIAIDRLDYKYQNTEENLLALIEKSAGISWDSNSRKAVFTEALPNKARTAGYAAYFNAYKQFASINLDGYDININAIADSATLSIQPYDINYTHISASQKKNPKPNQIIISPSKIDFNAYVVSIVLQGQDYTGTAEQVKTTDDNPVCLELSVYKEKSRKTLNYGKTWCNIDPQKSSTITVKTNGPASNDIQVKITPQGVLGITNNNSSQIIVESGIDFGNNAQSAPQVAIPRGMISVSESAFKIERK